MTSHFEEKEKAMKSEQDDLTSAHRKKCQLMEHNQTAEIERLKDLHKKVRKTNRKEAYTQRSVGERNERIDYYFK